jgi:hypothetical protein
LSAHGHCEHVVMTTAHSTIKVAGTIETVEWHGIISRAKYHQGCGSAHL